MRSDAWGSLAKNMTSTRKYLMSVDGLDAVFETVPVGDLPTVTEVKGGTNQTTYTLGDTLYSSATDTLSKLAGNTTTTKKFLRQTGNGSVSAAPAWDTIVAADLATALAAPGTIGGTTPGVASFSTLSASGDFAIATDKFTVASASGNTLVAGTLAVTSDVAINTNKFNITASSGATTVAGALTPTGGVAAAGGFAVSPRLIHTGNLAPATSAAGTDATPVATEVYIAEVFIPANCTVTGFANFNGSVASGNMKVGLANSSGAVVATSASTAMSGTDVFQRVDFTSPYAAVGPATYFVLLFLDNDTARINCHPFGNFGAAKQTGQVFATGFTTITAPSTFTADLAPMGGLY